MTDKEKIRAEIERLYNQSLADENRQAGRGLEGAASVSYGKSKACKELLSFIDSIQEEPTTSVQNEDIEQYARNEADKFASKEYEYHNDIGLLKKGFYWGCKAGANWQEQQIKKSAIYGIVAGRVKDEVFVASRWFKNDKLKPAEDIKLIIIKD